MTKFRKLYEAFISNLIKLKIKKKHTKMDAASILQLKDLISPDDEEKEVVVNPNKGSVFNPGDIGASIFFILFKRKVKNIEIFKKNKKKRHKKN